MAKHIGISGNWRIGSGWHPGRTLRRLCRCGRRGHGRGKNGQFGGGRILCTLGFLAGEPVVWQPGVDLADRRGGQIHQQLRQVQFGVDPVPLAGAGETRQDRRRLAAAFVTDNKEVLSIMLSSP